MTNETETVTNAAPTCFVCALMAVVSGWSYSRLHSMMHVDRDLPVVAMSARTADDTAA